MKIWQKFNKCGLSSLRYGSLLLGLAILASPSRSEPADVDLKMQAAVAGVCDTLLAGALAKNLGKGDSINLASNLRGYLNFLIVQRDNQGKPVTILEAQKIVESIVQDNGTNVFKSSTRSTIVEMQDGYRMLLPLFMRPEIDPTWQEGLKVLHKRKKDNINTLITTSKHSPNNMPVSSTDAFVAELQARMLEHAVIFWRLAGSINMPDVAARSMRNLYSDEKLQAKPGWEWLKKLRESTKGDYSKTAYPQPGYDDPTVIDGHVKGT